MVIVIMGVAGAGKTTVGTRLAADLGWPFIDGDDLHPPANVALMRAGASLTDAQRAPWLAALANLVGEHARADRPLVLACSALRRAYRTALRAATDDMQAVRFVHLSTHADVLADRLRRRAGHFFPPHLLKSQLATLEPPGRDEDVLVLDGALPAPELVGAIRAAFGI